MEDMKYLEIADLIEKISTLEEEPHNCHSCKLQTIYGTSNKARWNSMNKMTLEVMISHSNIAMRFARCNQISF